ncbi:hypothetical protein [Chondromyces crocatus]|uniref:Uncharacterized protein n=1 Tax=Chondromyces crocatus TaxID=52 RepID=A0A0K1EI01_CHOCO|nr:hypothetical protein [Chondromyces crocatus]AKT40208.1 uncharacterized protein CMC5_043610 [Chondromyces crocatus]
MAGAFAIALTAACDGSPPPSASLPPAPVVSASAPLQAVSATPPGETALSAASGSPSNPLGLPPLPTRLDPGKRVFTFSDRMLAAARPGSTLVMYSATVVGFDGDDLIIEGTGGTSYKVHPGYVIAVPDKPRIALQAPVLTAWNGVMKHAVIHRFVKDRVGVHLTDSDKRSPEVLLKDPWIVPQVDGLVPGNFAALQEKDTWNHVTLVSKLGGEGPKRWFVLGYGGAAKVVEEVALRPIPVKPRNLKAGLLVWAESVGVLRRAAVVGSDDVGFYTLKFERAGRPVRVGWGHLVPTLDGA